MNQEYDRQNEEVVTNAAKRLMYGDSFVHTKVGTTGHAGIKGPSFAAPPSERDDDDLIPLAQPRKKTFEQPVIVSVTGTELEVCKDIAQRQQVGIKKYGQTVLDNPLSLRAWLQHAYEESLDFPIYLKRAMAEIDKQTVVKQAWPLIDRVHGIAEKHMPLGRFYSASTTDTLIAAMERHVEKLQSDLASCRGDVGTSPTNPRQG